MRNYIKIQSQFGHEIMALLFGKVYGLPVIIIPNKDTKEEFDSESAKIYSNLSFFSNDLRTIPFEEREKYDELSWDVIADLKANNLPDEAWDKFASARLTPCHETSFLPKFASLKECGNILVVPQKLISDGECGITAAQQSVNPSVFNLLKNVEGRLVLGQHFNKVSDLETVKKLAEDFNMYVPGLTEDTEVLGIRGVSHAKYYNMYNKVTCSIGIAGTHTWYMLAMFPDIPQIILYNKNGVEHWDAIAAAMRKAGKMIYAIGFDENTNMAELSKKVEDTFHLR